MRMLCAFSSVTLSSEGCSSRVPRGTGFRRRSPRLLRTNADESLQDMLARQEALDKLIALYERSETLIAEKGVETLGEAGPEGEALANEIAAAEEELEALGGAPA